MLKIFFVRHAQSKHPWEEDRTRPLTEEGKQDSHKVLEFLRDKKINAFYCSPYKRSLDTIAEAAAYYKKEIITDERLRERKKGPGGNNQGMFQKRWGDLDYHEKGGESIRALQKRNMATLKEIIAANINHQDTSIVIGTHGTALSSILNYYDETYNCDSFLRMIDWMPYIIELDFDGEKLIDKKEHLYIEKEFQGKMQADNDK